jgi:hypothetical protein
MAKVWNFAETLAKAISKEAYEKAVRLAKFHNISLEQAVEDCIISAKDLGAKEKKDLEEREIEERRRQMKNSREM